jgi:hypothetical protein
MAKAGTPKAKPKPRLTDKEQSERFKEAARDLGIADDASEKFEEVFRNIAPPKRRPAS